MWGAADGAQLTGRTSHRITGLFYGIEYNGIKNKDLTLNSFMEKCRAYSVYQLASLLNKEQPTQN
jgi:hypothetical protein